MYEVLYYYSSDDFDLIEIKRLDLPESAPKDKIYHWLKVDGKTDVVQKLTFKSMDELSRTFEEGSLELKGIFNGVEMKKVDSKVLNERLDRLIKKGLFRAP